VVPFPAILTGSLCRHRVAALLIVVACLVGACGRASAATSLEYRVKAAFLFNFAKFIEWPPQTLGGPQAPYTICVLGQDPFGEELDVIARQTTVQGRSVAIRRPGEAKEASGCHILFIASSERPMLPAILAALGPAPTLTVGDDEEFNRLGGCLRFFIEESRVRFEINLPATERARLKLSSKLLNLARVIGKPSRRGRD
jgi:hypothetical protein